MGTVLGIAVLAAVFSAVGGYASGESFVNGLHAAQIVGTAVLAVGAILAFLIPAPAAVPSSASDAAKSRTDSEPAMTAV